MATTVDAGDVDLHVEDRGVPELVQSGRRIAVIVGSIREGRRGRGVGDWVMTQVADRDPDYVLVDLTDHPLTMRYEQKSDKTYDEPSTQAWSDLIDSFDGYVFVTPEYNRSVPAPLKNAVDLLFSE